MSVDPELLAAWVEARALSRGTARPIVEGDGFRVETALPHELRRRIFPAIGPGARAALASVTEPLDFVKVCAAPEAVAALAAPRWVMQPPAWMMAHGGLMEPAPAVPGYAFACERSGDAAAVAVTAPDGTPAAAGRAALWRGTLVYDQIATEAAHRRRGIGRLMLTTLQAAFPDAGRQVLTATSDGRALYATLGWRVISPYTTVVIPA